MDLCPSLPIPDWNWHIRTIRQTSCNSFHQAFNTLCINNIIYWLNIIYNMFKCCCITLPGMWSVEHCYFKKKYVMYIIMGIHFVIVWGRELFALVNLIGDSSLVTASEWRSLSNDKTIYNLIIMLPFILLAIINKTCSFYYKSQLTVNNVHW